MGHHGIHVRSRSRIRSQMASDPTPNLTNALLCIGVGTICSCVGSPLMGSIWLLLGIAFAIGSMWGHGRSKNNAREDRG
jgi:hypothetical protein